MKQDKFVVFDIDGTIFRSSTIIELVNLLVKKGIFSKSAEKDIEKDYSSWVNRKGDYRDYINKVVEVFENEIRGKDEKEVKHIIREMVAEQKDKLYVFTRELLEKLKKENYFLLAISGSPEIIVSEFAKALGFDEYYGSKYEVKNGKFTGKILDDIVWNKSFVLDKFLSKHKEFNLKNAIGVGDTEIDIPFLERVGNPIVFNPDIQLANYAKNSGWKIVVERKNVVYNIRDFDFEVTS